MCVTILQAAVACDWVIHENKALWGLMQRETHLCWMFRTRHLLNGGCDALESRGLRQLARSAGVELFDMHVTRPIPLAVQPSVLMRRVLLSSRPEDSSIRRRILFFAGPSRGRIYETCLAGLRVGFSESYVHALRTRAKEATGFSGVRNEDYAEIITQSVSSTNLSTILVPPNSCHGATGKAGSSRCCACGAPETDTFKLSRCMGWCGSSPCGFCPPAPNGTSECSSLVRGSLGRLWRTCACCMWGLPAETLGMLSEGPPVSPSTGWESTPASSQDEAAEDTLPPEGAFQFADGTFVEGCAVESQVLLEDGARIKEVALHLISTAQTEIIIASPWFDSPDIFRALGAAHSRGVEVLAIVSKDTFLKRNWTFPVIATHGHELSTLYPGLEGFGHDHDKGLSKDRLEVLSGSYNFTEAATFCNREMMVWTQDARFARMLAQRLLSKEAQFSFTPLDEDEKCRLEPLRQTALRRMLRRWHHVVRGTINVLRAAAESALEALELVDARHGTIHPELSYLKTTQERAAAVSVALQKAGLTFATVANLAKVSVSVERSVRKGTVKNVSQWQTIQDLPNKLLLRQELPDRSCDLEVVTPPWDPEEALWTFQSGTFKDEPFENVFISSPQAILQVCRKVPTDEVLTDEWRSFVGWLMAKHRDFLPVEVRAHLEEDAGLALAFGCARLSPTAAVAPYVSTPVKRLARSRRLQGSQPENQGLGEFGEVVSTFGEGCWTESPADIAEVIAMFDGDESVRAEATAQTPAVHLPGLEGVAQEKPPPPGYHHRANIVFGTPMDTMENGLMFQCVLDTGASTNVLPVQVLQEVLRADALGKNGLQREVIISIIKWTTPIPFSGVFGSHLCEFGAMLHCTFDGVFSRPICFRVLQTRDILIGAPLLDICGWNSSEYTFTSFGASGGPTGQGFVSVTPVGRASNV